MICSTEVRSPKFKGFLIAFLPKALIVRALGHLSNAAVAAVNDYLRDTLAF